MEFRWIALLAIWTILSGPILGGPSGTASRAKDKPQTVKSVRHTSNVRSTGR
jgi:hypothetical protein